MVFFFDNFFIFIFCNFTEKFKKLLKDFLIKKILRSLVKRSFVPSVKWTSVLYCRLTDFKTRRTSCLLILETVPTPYFMVFPILYTYIQYTKALSICANFTSTQGSSYLDSDLVGSWHISLEYISRNLYPVSIFCFILSCVSSYFYQIKNLQYMH